jgi:hypothetical protein
VLAPRAKVSLRSRLPRESIIHAWVLMSTAFTRSYVALTYMLGARGEALVQALPKPVAESEVSLVRGLQNPERQVRARHLAVSVRDVTTDLEQRELGLVSP